MMHAVLPRVFGLGAPEWIVLLVLAGGGVPLVGGRDRGRRPPPSRRERLFLFALGTALALGVGVLLARKNHTRIEDWAPILLKLLV